MPKGKHTNAVMHLYELNLLQEVKRGTEKLISERGDYRSVV
jgi:hypothetical protein